MSSGTDHRRTEVFPLVLTDGVTVPPSRTPGHRHFGPFSPQDTLYSSRPSGSDSDTTQTPAYNRGGAGAGAFFEDARVFHSHGSNQYVPATHTEGREVAEHRAGTASGTEKSCPSRRPITPVRPCSVACRSSNDESQGVAHHSVFHVPPYSSGSWSLDSPSPPLRFVSSRHHGRRPDPC